MIAVFSIGVVMCIVVGALPFSFVDAEVSLFSYALYGSQVFEDGGISRFA